MIFLISNVENSLLPHELTSFGNVQCRTDTCLPNVFYLIYKISLIFMNMQMR